MTGAEALAVVRAVCDAHLCNAGTRRTIDAALDQLRVVVVAYDDDIADLARAGANGDTDRG